MLKGGSDKDPPADYFREINGKTVPFVGEEGKGRAANPPPDDIARKIRGKKAAGEDTDLGGYEIQASDIPSDKVLQKEGERLGSGMSGTVYATEINGHKAAVKYGIIEVKELEASKELGEMGVGPKVLGHDVTHERFKAFEDFREEAMDADEDSDLYEDYKMMEGAVIDEGSTHLPDEFKNKLVTERLEGYTSASDGAFKGEGSEQRVKDLFAAVEKVHGAGWIHGDLGVGDNIMVHPETGDIKLIDFGEASKRNPYIHLEVNELANFLPGHLREKVVSVARDSAKELRSLERGDAAGWDRVVGEMWGGINEVLSGDWSESSKGPKVRLTRSDLRISKMKDGVQVIKYKGQEIGKIETVEGKYHPYYRFEGAEKKWDRPKMAISDFIRNHNRNL